MILELDFSPLIFYVSLTSDSLVLPSIEDPEGLQISGLLPIRVPTETADKLPDSSSSWFSADSVSESSLTDAGSRDPVKDLLLQSTAKRWIFVLLCQGAF